MPKSLFWSYVWQLLSRIWTLPKNQSMRWKYVYYRSWNKWNCHLQLHRDIFEVNFKDHRKNICPHGHFHLLVWPLQKIPLKVSWSGAPSFTHSAPGRTRTCMHMHTDQSDEPWGHCAPYLSEPWSPDCSTWLHMLQIAQRDCIVCRLTAQSADCANRQVAKVDYKFIYHLKNSLFLFCL